MSEVPSTLSSLLDMPLKHACELGVITSSVVCVLSWLDQAVVCILN